MGIQNKSITPKASVMLPRSPSPPPPPPALTEVLARQLCPPGPGNCISSSASDAFRGTPPFSQYPPLCFSLMTCELHTFAHLSLRVCLRTAGFALWVQEKRTLLLPNSICKKLWRKNIRCFVGSAKDLLFSMPVNSRCQISRNGMFSDARSEKYFPNLSAVPPRDI